MLFIPALLDRGQPTPQQLRAGDHRSALLRRPGLTGGLHRLRRHAASRLYACSEPAPGRHSRHPRRGRSRLPAVAGLLRPGAAPAAASPYSHDYNEALMWGGGHVLQFVNTLLLIAAWPACDAVRHPAADACTRPRQRGAPGGAARARFLLSLPTVFARTDAGVYLAAIHPGSAGIDHGGRRPRPPSPAVAGENRRSLR